MRKGLRSIIHTFIFLLVAFDGMAQSACPSNIGFEKGSFLGWQCYDGYIDTTGFLHLFPGPPMYNTHTIIGRDSAQAKDYYGEFPVLCPNGSGYSVRLGNDAFGSRAEGISYEFTIPANALDYSIIYNYAVVLQSPGHVDYQQPRFTAKVFDIDNGTYIDCSSFEFKASASLPGFYTSPKSPGVQCKSWSAVTIDLAGYAGRRLRLEFSSNDCAPGAHFGYVYLDVNENCSSAVSGTYICPGDTSLTLTAPFGFSTYNWYNADFSSLLGTGSSLYLNPMPSVNTQFALEVIPFAGLGCRDTIISLIKAISDPMNLQINDPVEACKISGADITNSSITAGSSTNLSITYHPDATATSFLSSPTSIFSSGTYFIKGTTQNGCKIIKPITVALQDSPTLIVHSPPAVVFPATIDITASSLTSGSSNNLQYSYWQDQQATLPLLNPKAINISGTCYLKVVSGLGCSSTAPVKVIVNAPPPYELFVVTAFSPNNDGINESFKIDVKGEMEIKAISIYDRWGKLLFLDTSGKKEWVGKYNNKDLPMGVYYWVLEGVDKYTKNKVMHTGSVMLIR